MNTLPSAAERFLDGLRTGDWEGMEQHFTPDAIHDGSMPGWRVQYAGPQHIVQAYRDEWTVQGTWSIPEPRVTRAGDVVIVELEGTIEVPGDPLLCRIVNFFHLRDGRIAEHRYYCCGEWDEETVHHIEAHAPNLERQQALT